MKKAQKPLVSILLLNWNGIDFTNKCVVSLLKTNYRNREIILVDNGSFNNEAEKLQRKFKNQIRVVPLKENQGYAKGMNIAYENARGKYVMFVNNDMEFRSDWLDPLVSVLENNPAIGACQPKLVKLNDTKYFDYASAAGGYVDILGYPFARGRIFTNTEKDLGQYEKIIKISWNGIFLARREVLEKTGLFNSLYFNYGEDMDICFRIYGQGHYIVNVPKSVVYHESGGALKKDLVKKMFFHHRNNLILILINWPLQYLFFVVPVRMLLDLVAIFYYLAIDFQAGSKGVVKAYLSLLWMLSQIKKEREKTQKIIKKENRRLMPMYKGSIVWQYFILRKKTFREVIDESKYVVGK